MFVNLFKRDKVTKALRHKGEEKKGHREIEEQRHGKT
jgi:hypothetical protein